MKVLVKKEVYRTNIRYTVRGDKTNTVHTYVAMDKLSESKAKALVTSIITGNQKNAKMAYNWVESNIETATIEQEIEVDETTLDWVGYEIPTRKSRKKASSVQPDDEQADNDKAESDNGGVEI